MKWIYGFIIPALMVSCANGNTSLSTAPTTPQPAQTTATTIAQSPPASPDAATATVIKTGRFESGEHATQGTAQLIREGEAHYLVLDESFQTSTSGPDLVVILHRSANVLGSTEPPAYPINEGDYVVLAPLQAFNGTQRYAIPTTINLDDYQSAGIWCRRFNATFGSATLQ